MLITVMGPRKSVDLELPDETAIGELIPLIVQAMGLSSGNPKADGASAWGLGPQQGQPFAPKATLTDSGIVDGAILWFRQLTAWRASAQPAPQPVRQPVAQTAAQLARTPVAARQIQQSPPPNQQPPQRTPAPPPAYQPQRPSQTPVQQPTQSPNPGGIGIRWNKDGL
ncbi:MAG TPA: EsaB/YukD family protein [Ktedonobacterales bacterium]|nr:EsaB/YukD family protein [Ktedonobacterales bacterium]